MNSAECVEGHNIVVGDGVFAVCNTIPGSIRTITGENMCLNVTYFGQRVCGALRQCRNWVSPGSESNCCDEPL